MKLFTGVLLFFFSAGLFSVAYANDDINTSISAGTPLGTTSDDTAIRNVLLHTWNKPEARLLVEPVVIVGDYAIAGWTQGDRGGRALLARHQAEWQVMLCSGDGVKEVSLLEEAGLSAAQARELATKLDKAEAILPEPLLKKMAQFGQTIKMDNGHGIRHSGH